MSESVKLAVFPVAGFGTRFLPATKACPKEMLPIVDKPLIQYAVEEAYEAGIRTMVFITGRNKWAITEHYDVAYELERELEEQGKSALLRAVQQVKPADMNVIFIRQERALGLGHAVLCARSVVRHQPFAVLLADDLVMNTGGASALKQMIDVFEKHQQGVLGVMEVAREDTHKYGIVTEGVGLDERLCTLAGIVEKPKPELAPSRLAVVGRYILPARIMDILQHTSQGANGEIQLTDAIARLIDEKTVLAYRFEGKRFDCGDKLGYLQANVEVALQHELLGRDFAHYLKHYVNQLGE
ncbi:MAG: UTP--glucose-1-phosphate uridylyltransferase GalU [Cardiobacteriaceae bacterium]|nr:UTP--glucose-1-phosphate uridylyltransferase GalU [Cardiobacteriaceae bacterium]